MNPALQWKAWGYRLGRRVVSVAARFSGPGATRWLVQLGRVAVRYGARERRRYAEWVQQYDTLTAADEEAIRRHAGSLASRPLLSVLVPVYNPSPAGLRACIESVRRQLYPHWELCLVDDASSDPAVHDILREYDAADERIRVTYRKHNGHIAAASNTGLETVAGSHVALLDHDDELAPHALFLVAVEVNRHPGAVVIYSDEDKLDTRGRRYAPYFKPDWNPELLRAQNYVSHLGVYSTRAVREAGGFREGFEGCQDWDLLWRVAERAPPSGVRHIPHVLYHWRAGHGSTARTVRAKTYSLEAGRRTLAEHVARMGWRAEVVPALEGFWRLRYALPDPPPLVSVIVPTRDNHHMLKRCVDGLQHQTAYRPLEILVVDNGTGEPGFDAAIGYGKRGSPVTVVRAPETFNYGALNNRAAAQAKGKVLVFLNDDVAVRRPDWLDEMVSVAVRPDVGVVGAMLYYPDGAIQHAGIVLGVHGVAAHCYAGKLRGHTGQFGRCALAQNLSAVTAACCCLRKSVFEEVGGFEQEHLQVAYNDVDLCLRIEAKGYRNVWTPFAELTHVESASRGPDTDSENRARLNRESEYMQRTWGERLRHDPAYSPNLTLEDYPFTLAFPPRTEKPWR